MEFKESLMGEKYRIYRNSPICPKCNQPMQYMYTNLASNKSMWKCRDCNTEKVEYGLPEDDEGDPSKRLLVVELAFIEVDEKHSLFVCL